MTHWRSQKQDVFRASALKLCALIHCFFLLLPVKLTHLDLLLTIQRQSESHALTWEQSNACAGLDQRSSSELVPVPTYVCWRCGNRTCTVFTTQVSHTFMQRHSEGPDYLLYSFPSTASHFIHFLSSERLANIFMELIILSCFLFLLFWPAVYPRKGLSLCCVTAYKAFWKSKLSLTPLCVPGPLHPGTTAPSRQTTPKNCHLNKATPIILVQ